MSGAPIHNFTLVSVAVLVGASRAIAAFPRQPPNDPLYAPAMCPPMFSCTGPTGHATCWTR